MERLDLRMGCLGMWYMLLLCLRMSIQERRRDLGEEGLLPVARVIGLLGL